MKVSEKIITKWGEQLVEYYKGNVSFDQKKLTIDMLRLSEPLRLYRVLCSSAYLGTPKEFAGGVLTKDILKVTGWKMPNKATDAQINQDNKKSIDIEKKCRKYISQEKTNEIIKNNGCVLPVEWRMFYVCFVPGTIFTPEERNFIANNPCWLLPLADNPRQYQS